MRAVVAAVVVAAAHGRRLGRLGLLLLLVELLDGLDLLLELHPPVLEPDLDLALRQAELVRHLYPPPPGEVVVGVELLLQLEGLVAGVGLAAAPPEAVGACEEVGAAWKKRKESVKYFAMQFNHCSLNYGSLLENMFDRNFAMFSPE